MTEQIESIIQRAERQADTIRLEAERDAEDMRREAVDAAKRLLDRLHALEFPLGELVVSLREEVEQVSRELGRGEHVDSQATSLPSFPESAHAETGNDEAFSEREVGPVDEERPGTDTDLPTDEPPLQPAEPQLASREGSEVEPTLAAGPEGPRSGKVGRRNRRPRSKQPARPFVTSEGHCTVCHRTYMPGSEDELDLNGWRISGDVGLCPNCQVDGWQLPDGARLPVRPGRR